MYEVIKSEFLLHLPVARRGCARKSNLSGVMLQGNYPALNKVAQSASKGRATQTRVEFTPIDGSPRVMHCYDASWRGACAAPFALLNHLIHHAFLQAFHAFFFLFLFQPSFVGFYIFTFCHVVGGCCDYFVILQVLLRHVLPGFGQ